MDTDNGSDNVHQRRMGNQTMSKTAKPHLCALSSDSRDTEDHGQWTRILVRECAQEYSYGCPMSRLKHAIPSNNN